MQVTKLPRGRADYYLFDLAEEIALPSGSAVGARHGGGAAGRWVGGGSAGLGLSGAVAGARFAGMLDREGSGEPFFPPGTTVAGFDLTFSAPKSVSLLFALGRSDVSSVVRDAHDDAVGAAVAYVDAWAVTVRCGTGDDREVMATGGAVGAAFTHGASRALDPHLHTHVVVVNAARGADGQWRALDGRGLYAHAAAAGALYRSHLRSALTERLRVEWRARPGSPSGWELAGVDDFALGTFSARAAEIRQQQWEWGSVSRRSARLAWAVTRPDKAPGSVRADLGRRWAEEARAIGLGPEVLDRVVGRPRTAGPGIDEHRLAATLWVSPHATAARRDVVRAWADAARPGAPASEVVRSVDAWLPDQRGRGVSEPRHALRGIIPPGHLLRALGPRPLLADQQRVWQLGAAAIERYRQRWGVTSRAHPLGLDEAGDAVSSRAVLAALGTRRLADHLEVRRTLDGVARQLGRERSIHTRDQGREIDR